MYVKSSLPPVGSARRIMNRKAGLAALSYTSKLRRHCCEFLRQTTAIIAGFFFFFNQQQVVLSDSQKTWRHSPIWSLPFSSCLFFQTRMKTSTTNDKGLLVWQASTSEDTRNCGSKSYLQNVYDIWDSLKLCSPSYRPDWKMRVIWSKYVCR